MPKLTLVASNPAQSYPMHYGPEPNRHVRVQSFNPTHPITDKIDFSINLSSEIYEDRATFENYVRSNNGTVVAMSYSSRVEGQQTLRSLRAENYEQPKIANQDQKFYLGQQSLKQAHQNPDIGYVGALVYHPEFGYILVHAGTKPHPGDLAMDLGIPLGINHAQYQQSLDFAKYVIKTFNIDTRTWYVVGHSKGSNIGEVTVYVYGGVSIGVDGPPLSRRLLKHYIPTDVSTTYIKFQSNPNIVNGAVENKYGQIYYLDPTKYQNLNQISGFWPYLLSIHSITRLIAEIESGRVFSFPQQIDRKFNPTGHPVYDYFIRLMWNAYQKYVSPKIHPQEINSSPLAPFEEEVDKPEGYDVIFDTYNNLLTIKTNKKTEKEISEPVIIIDLDALPPELFYEYMNIDPRSLRTTYEPLLPPDLVKPSLSPVEKAIGKASEIRDSLGITLEIDESRKMIKWKVDDPITAVIMTVISFAIQFVGDLSIKKLRHELKKVADIFQEYHAKIDPLFKTANTLGGGSQEDISKRKQEIIDEIAKIDKELLECEYNAKSQADKVKKDKHKKREVKKSWRSALAALEELKKFYLNLLSDMEYYETIHDSNNKELLQNLRLEHTPDEQKVIVLSLMDRAAEQLKKGNTVAAKKIIDDMNRVVSENNIELSDDLKTHIKHFDLIIEINNHLAKEEYVEAYKVFEDNPELTENNTNLEKFRVECEIFKYIVTDTKVAREKIDELKKNTSPDDKEGNKVIADLNLMLSMHQYKIGEINFKGLYQLYLSDKDTYFKGWHQVLSIRHEIVRTGSTFAINLLARLAANYEKTPAAAKELLDTLQTINYIMPSALPWGVHMILNGYASGLNDGLDFFTREVNYLFNSTDSLAERIHTGFNDGLGFASTILAAARVYYPENYYLCVCSYFLQSGFYASQTIDFTVRTILHGFSINNLVCAPITLLSLALQFLGRRIERHKALSGSIPENITYHLGKIILSTGLNLFKPILHIMLPITNVLGITQTVLGIAQSVTDICFGGLHFSMQKAVLDNMQGLLDSKKYKQLINTYQKKYNLLEKKFPKTPPEVKAIHPNIFVLHFFAVMSLMLEESRYEEAIKFSTVHLIDNDYCVKPQEIPIKQMPNMLDFRAEALRSQRIKISINYKSSRDETEKDYQLGLLTTHEYTAKTQELNEQLKKDFVLSSLLLDEVIELMYLLQSGRVAHLLLYQSCQTTQNLLAAALHLIQHIASLSENPRKKFLETPHVMDCMSVNPSTYGFSNFVQKTTVKTDILSSLFENAFNEQSYSEQNTIKLFYTCSYIILTQKDTTLVDLAWGCLIHKINSTPNKDDKKWQILDLVIDMYKYTSDTVSEQTTPFSKLSEFLTSLLSTGHYDKKSFTRLFAEEIKLAQAYISDPFDTDMFVTSDVVTAYKRGMVALILSLTNNRNKEDLHHAKYLNLAFKYGIMPDLPLLYSKAFSLSLKDEVLWVLNSHNFNKFTYPQKYALLRDIINTPLEARNFETFHELVVAQENIHLTTEEIVSREEQPSSLGITEESVIAISLLMLAKFSKDQSELSNISSENLFSTAVRLVESKKEELKSDKNLIDLHITGSVNSYVNGPVLFKNNPKFHDYQIIYAEANYKFYQQKPFLDGVARVISSTPNFLTNILVRIFHNQPLLSNHEVIMGKSPSIFENCKTFVIFPYLKYQLELKQSKEKDGTYTYILNFTLPSHTSVDYTLHLCIYSKNTFETKAKIKKCEALLELIKSAQEKELTFDVDTLFTPLSKLVKPKKTEIKARPSHANSGVYLARNLVAQQSMRKVSENSPATAAALSRLVH